MGPQLATVPSVLASFILNTEQAEGLYRQWHLGRDTKGYLNHWDWFGGQDGKEGREALHAVEGKQYGLIKVRTAVVACSSMMSFEKFLGLY